MKALIVDISDFRISDDPAMEIVTYALGSCIGVAVWDPRRLVGGMLHYMLPGSAATPDKAAAVPAMFADTGIPLLFRSVYEYGCRKEDLVVTVAGGASLYDDHGVFEIGKRNYTMLRKLFWKSGVIITAEDVGGTHSRTMRLLVGSGKVTIKSMGEKEEILCDSSTR